MSSPPVALHRVCANGPGRLRHVRARTISVEFLVLATSILFLASSQQARAQFPIRQVPGRTSGGLQVRPVDGPVNPRNHAGPAAGATNSTLPAVARIVVPEKDGISYGSGTLVDARGQFGLVISNWHVVRDAAGQITVEFPDGHKSPAEVIKTDKDWDLAALSIYRPRASPVPVSPAAPQPGDSLTIAGYGSGDWRITSGRCTQYLAPGVNFPHEMVELAAEARQGDSGGPILNDRGELAGVLFGSGPGYTSGSYGGRVLKFLATVVPGGAPGNDGLPPNSLPSDRALAAAEPGYPPPALPTASLPQATALHDSNPPHPQPNELTPALQPTSDPLLTPPPRGEVARRFGPNPTSVSTSDVDPRVAVVPSRLDLNSPPLNSEAAPYANSTTALFDAGDSPERDDLRDAPHKELLAVIWQRVGGPTLFDQTKAVLAIIGILSLVVVFLRFGSQKEHEHHEE